MSKLPGRLKKVYRGDHVLQKLNGSLNLYGLVAIATAKGLKTENE